MTVSYKASKYEAHQDHVWVTTFTLQSAPGLNELDRPCRTESKLQDKDIVCTTYRTWPTDQSYVCLQKFGEIKPVDLPAVLFVLRSIILS